MLKSSTKAILLFFILSMINLPVSAADDVVRARPEMGEMAGDFLLRPVFVGVTLIGTSVFILGSPFSILGGNFKESFVVLVAKPFTTTFLRCLGCKSSDRSLKIVDQYEEEIKNN